MNYKHLVKEIKENSQLFKHKNAVYHKNKEANKWEGISWLDFESKIETLSKALINYGVSVQQNIAIFSQNMPNWIIADIAIMRIRAVTVPIYATNSKKEVDYVLNDAEVSLLFVGDQKEYDKAYKLLETSKYLKLIVALTNTIKLQPSNNSIHLEDFMAFQSTEKIETELEKRFNSICIFRRLIIW